MGLMITKMSVNLAFGRFLHGFFATAIKKALDMTTVKNRLRSDDAALLSLKALPEFQGSFRASKVLIHLKWSSQRCIDACDRAVSRGVLLRSYEDELSHVFAK